MGGGESNNYYVLLEKKWETDFSDFHGLSKHCEIQHQLLLESLLNGENSSIMKSNITVPVKFGNESAKYKIELGTITSYQKIWFTIVIVKDFSNRPNEWTKYSLTFINDKLIGQMIEEWHID